MKATRRSDAPLITRTWAMPNKWTFKIKPIAELVHREMAGGGIWVDPFSGMTSPATVTNDLNPDMPTMFHMDALDFLRSFSDQSVDGVLFDPPYSQRQVQECYAGIQGGLKWDWRMTFWSRTKDEAARIIKPGGKVLCFGWNSMGFGIGRGFQMTRILLVPHGGSRHDTIATVEIKRACESEQLTMFPQTTICEEDK